MGIVKARFKTLVGDSTLSTEDADLQPRIADEGYASDSVSDGHQEYGVGVSMNAREDSGTDEVHSRIVGAFGGPDINVSAAVEGRFDDSEIRGASCLLKMRETGRESWVLRSSAAANSGKLNSTDVSCTGGGDLVLEENGKCLDENDEDLDDKIETINVPIAETSENMDNGEEEDLDEEGFEFSVGDFVWGKIKSHPWWPGQIYNPSDASEYALKLKQRNRLLVAYFGDGTFAWCHPSQLKPFKESFEEMSRQSNSKSFQNALQEAVDEIGRLIELNMICYCVPKEHCLGLQSLALNAGKNGVLLPEGRILQISGFLSEPAEILDEMKGMACRVSTNSLLQLKILESQLSAFYRSMGGHQLPTYHEPLLISGLEDSLNDDRIDTSRVNVQGPFEEDWLSSPFSPKFGQTDKPMLQNCQVISGNRQYQRRKQKSIAEIMDSEVGSTAKGTSSENKLSPKEEIKRKKKLIEFSFHTSIDDSVVENGGSKSNSSSKRRKKGEADSTENEVGGQKEHASEEKKIYSDCIQSDEEQTEKSSLARERRKSKYLSPPFTSLSKGKKRKDIEEESLKVSKEAHLGERMAAAASNIARSPPILRIDNEMFQKKLPKDIDMEHKTLESLDPQTPKQDENETIDQLKVKESTDRVLSEVRLVALDPLYPRLTESIKIVEDFMSTFRRSVYRNGSYYKAYNRHRLGRKPEISNLEHGSPSEDQNQRVEHSSEGKKIRNSKKMKLDKPKSEQEAGRQGAESANSKPNKVDETTKLKNDTNEGNDSTASLFVTFVPGSSLPSKADLLKIYSKFGTLNEAETEMFLHNFCARVVFLKISEAEEAFNCSQNVNPFGASNATFRLRYSSQALKTHGLCELPRPEASPPSIVESSQLQLIRQKLEKLISMVENSGGKVSRDLKSKLEGEIKDLLDEVSTMVESSS